MGVLIRSQKGMPVFTGIAKLSVVSFLVSLSISLIDTIWAIYLDSFLHSESSVGFLSSFLTFVAFFAFFVFVPLIEKKNKSKIFSYSLFLFGIFYLLFSVNNNLYFMILLSVIITLLQTLRLTSFGIIIKDKSQKKQLSRNEGLIYTFSNTAWVIGPLIAGYIANQYNLKIVFIVSSGLIFLAFFLFKLSNIKDSNIQKKTDHVLSNFIEFFKNKQRTYAYLLHGGVAMWWVLVYLFIPLEIVRSSLGKLGVGYFLFAVAVPLILTEYYFSKLAGKIGFKKVFKLGFLIVSALSIACFFINSLIIILILIVLASFGIAMLEPTTEAHFFNTLKDHESVRFYGPYNTTINTNQFIIKILASTILIFLPFKYLFLLFGGFMFVFFLISFRIKDTIERKR